MSQVNRESRRVAWSVSDQAVVSATNFLTIAIGAWLLSLPEQSKLVYAYSAYIALVLFNASALFSVAPMLRLEVSDTAAYKQTLFYAQCIIALAGAALFVLLFSVFGDVLEWDATTKEMSYLFAFLVLQQLADFNRRSGYVFNTIVSAALLSTGILSIRLVLLFLLKPDQVETFLLLLAVSAIPGALAALSSGLSSRKNADESNLFQKHISLARWNMLSTPLQWSGLHLPILLVGALAGSGAAAILATIRSLSTIANVFLELMETYVPMWMSTHEQRHGDKGLRSVVVRLYAIGFAVWAVAALVIATFGEALLALLLGRPYADYWPILLLLWIGNGLFFLGRVYGVRYRVMRRTSVELIGSAGGAAVLLVAYPLITQHGAIGGAWVIVLVQLGCVITQQIYTRYFMRNPDPIIG